MIREKVKNLWKLCFNDSEEFIDMYFRLRYNNNVNITIESGDNVIAALQMLPYPMTFGGTEIHTAYVSGACTHPDYRNRGVMQELLSQAFIRMLHNNVAISTLIPAESWLFDYYAQNGYATVFNYNKFLFKVPQITSPQNTPVLKITDKYKNEVYDYFNRKLRERDYCIQHTETDFRVILSDLQLSGGHVFTLNHEGSIVALAIAYPDNQGRWHIGELLSDTPEISSWLLQRICKEIKISTLEVLTPPVAEKENHPLGMARIINAKAILQLYASIHPELELNILLTDEQISANNGHYYLSNGKCMNSTKRLHSSHLALTIGELTEKIFIASRPYMSLMLN